MERPSKYNSNTFSLLFFNLLLIRNTYSTESESVNNGFNLFINLRKNPLFSTTDLATLHMALALIMADQNG